ncbi:LPD7 domain-containing protein [Halomonas sp. HP20-15]|uniref:LPD7 domain-containing protein n=1 Tax=Halomonas sp. HP20-15 TaxID=3085901 RepID=UPI002980EB24|nr:LPD7 domain-containing protein [Halomonas sp. HP20-15]MDW5378839.1 LPD7 domain-containing protein [Halomonas sp. HP20-15]
MAQEQIADKNTYLVVPFEEKDEAVKAAGKLPDGSNAITFDGDNKLWYAKPGADLSKVSQWAPDPAKANSTSAENDPQVEFARTLEAEGFVLDGLPEMDGRRHRVKTQDDKRGQRTGVYVGYLDGVPAGWYQDHRVHEDPVKWKATGQKLDHEAQAHLRAQALQRKMERQAKQERSYDHNARRAGQVYALMPAATPDQGYLQNKGVKPFPGAKMDKRGRLVLPLKNENDEVRTLQRIDRTGFKSLKKNGQKTGNYFVVGDRELQNGEPILYAEGYSTSASIAEATGRPVVMTVDAGNLPRVAEKLKDKYPASSHIVLGDDDRDNKVNKGREKAEEAATLTSGAFRVPEFNDQEKQAGLTDFNDLHQSRGLDAVREQVEQIVAQSAKVENMSEEKNEKTNDPVISENFERYVNQGLNREQEQDQERAQQPALETVEQEAEPVQEQAPEVDQEEAAADQQEGDGENSIEPHIEQKQESEADNDARQWLQSSRRQSLKDMLAEEEARTEARREQQDRENRQDPASLQVGKPAPAAQQDDPFADQEQTTFKPVVPEKVAKSYLEVEGKYYFAGRPDSLAFVDKGARLQTKLSNAQVAGSMVDIAESRGWTEIQVKGTQDFRREAWLEAASRGLEVRGYKPREEDLARLKKLATERQPNEIEAREQADQPRTNKGQPSRPRQQSEAAKPREAASQTQERAQEATQAAQESQAGEPVNRLAGKVVEHGKAPYEHNKDNRESYYVTLENADGEKSTTWGVDLERAMEESGAKEGDTVELENQGRQPVTVNRPVKDEQGKVVRTEQINTHRNKWDVKAEALQDRERDAKELVREHPDLVNEVAAIKVAEKFSQKQFSNEADRERFMDKVRTQVAGNVSKGQQAPEVKLREERVTEKENDNER